MGSKMAALTKMQICGLFGINRLVHSRTGAQRKKAAALGGMALGAGIAAAALSATASWGLAAAGSAGALPAVATLACTFSVLMLTFLKSPGVLAGGADYDLVMSLPATPAQVVAGRLVPVYLANALLCAVVMVPAAIVLAVLQAASALGAFLLLLSCLLVPVVPMAVSLAAGTAVAVVSSRSRRSNAVSLALSTLAVLAIVAATAVLNQANADDVAHAVGALAAAFAATWPPAAFVEGAASGNGLSLAALAALSAVVAAAFIALAARFYRSINNARPQRRAGSLRIEDPGVSTPFCALWRREFSRYFSCTIYALNSSIGMVLLLALSVLVLVAGIPAIEAYGGAVDVRAMLSGALPLIVAVFVSMTCTTSASLSLEGKNRWIIESAPVRPIEVFRAKIAVNLCVIAPLACASIALLAGALQVEGLDLVFLIAVPAAYACFIPVLGMYLNVRFPRYDWTSEYYAVKGGAVSVLATTAVGMLCSIVPLAACLAFPLGAKPIMAGAAAVLLVAAAVLYGRLEGCRLCEP